MIDEVKIVKPERLDKPTEERSGKQTATIQNNSNSRTIELDFGRDKEVRVAPFETVKIPKELLNHPAFVAEKSNFNIVRG